MKKIIIGITLLAALALLPSSTLLAADYQIDTKGAHAYIAFKINHLGFSMVMGRFNTFNGTFQYDENNPAVFSTQVTVDVASVDSNQAERDKHLRGKDFFHVDEYPEASFVSTGYKDQGDGKGTLTGNLTLRGVTKPIILAIEQMESGKDPWGNFRHGFSGKTTLTLKEFGIPFDLGPKGEEAQLEFSVEGIRQ